MIITFEKESGKWKGQGGGGVLKISYDFPDVDCSAVLSFLCQFSVFLYFYMSPSDKTSV